MKNEADFKTMFRKSVRSCGGFSISLTATMMGGIPDLFCIMPGFMPIMIEAKWLGSLGPKFRRKIQYTAQQRDFLDNCNLIKVNSAVGLIGFKQDGKTFAVLKPRILKEENETLESTTVWNTPYVQVYGTIDVCLLFDRAGITRINGASDYQMAIRGCSA